MKKAIIISIVILISISAKSQVYETWSDPVALTDTSSFNSNPDVFVMNWDEIYMFYEKRESQSGNGQIWWRSIPYPEDEQLFINGFPDFDCRNPKVVGNNFLIFECNAQGNYNLYGIKFDETGPVGNSFQLTNTDYDVNSFFNSKSFTICCWETEGNIIVADIQYFQDSIQFADIEIIDTANCFDPVCKNNFIAWRKVEEGESHIFYSEIEYPSTEWSEPDTITQTNDNTQLSISRTLDWFDGGDILCWQSSDSIHFSGTPGWNLEISTPDIEGIDQYYEPTSFDLVFLTDDYFPSLYSFAGEAGSIRDIYINDYWFSNDPINITNDPEINKNPELFFGGEHGYYYDVFNIWQTEIEGYDVLFLSKASYIFGAIKENNAIHLDISPNPVGNGQNIIISSTENIKIYSAQVYSISGKFILKRDFESNYEKYEIDLGNALPGVYFIKIQTSKGEMLRKLIKK
jgi:hypothetical protein